MGLTAVIVAAPPGDAFRLAGLGVLDRLAVSLSRSGIGKILFVGDPWVELPRTRALGIQVERLRALSARYGPVLVSEGNLLIGVKDLQDLMRNPGRMITRNGERLSVGVLDKFEADWRSRLDELPEVIAKGPAGNVTDRKSAARVEREYWASLVSDSDGLVDRGFNRPVGRWLSKALVETPVTPNQVSVAATLMGLISALMFSVCGWWVTVGAAIVLQLSAIVDCVDGDLARAKCRESNLGKWLDIVGDQVVHLAVFLGLGLGLWRSGMGQSVVVLGVIAALGVVVSFLVVVRAKVRLQLRGKSRVQRLIDATTNRDFSVLLILCAFGEALDWFLWLAAVGSHVFWMAALTLQLLEGKAKSGDEQAG